MPYADPAKRALKRFATGEEIIQKKQQAIKTGRKIQTRRTEKRIWPNMRRINRVLGDEMLNNI